MASLFHNSNLSKRHFLAAIGVASAATMVSAAAVKPATQTPEERLAAAIEELKSALVARHPFITEFVALENADDPEAAPFVFFARRDVA